VDVALLVVPQSFVPYWPVSVTLGSPVAEGVYVAEYWAETETEREPTRAAKRESREAILQAVDGGKKIGTRERGRRRAQQEQQQHGQQQQQKQGGRRGDEGESSTTFYIFLSPDTPGESPSR
jgi:hypothetical protein